MKKEEQQMIIIEFSLGHLYPSARRTMKILKSDVLYWGKRYLDEKYLMGGEIKERAKEMVFPYFYIHNF